MSKTNEAIKNFSKNIGTNIHSHRKRLGLTQEQLAKKANERFPDWKLNQTTLSRYEKGKSVMSSLVFFRFCEILEVHSSELCPINSNKEISPYTVKECLEAEEDFKKSLCEHLRNFIFTDTGKAPTEKHSKTSPENDSARSIYKLHKEITSFAEEALFVDSNNQCIDPRTIYNYFSEKRIPSLDCLFLICKVIETELSELIS